MGYTIPEIISENKSKSIVSELFSRREIVCMGDITDEHAYNLILQLRYLQSVNPNEEIVIHINSHGGYLHSGLAIYDVMKASTCPIRTICTGRASSIAAVIFMSGDIREITNHSKVMIHKPYLTDAWGNISEMEDIVKELSKDTKTIAAIIAEHTGHTTNEVYEKMIRDAFFDAEECIKWGIADRIIT